MLRDDVELLRRLFEALVSREKPFATGHSEKVLDTARLFSMMEKQTPAAAKLRTLFGLHTKHQLPMLHATASNHETLNFPRFTSVFMPSFQNAISLTWPHSAASPGTGEGKLAVLNAIADLHAGSAGVVAASPSISIPAQGYEHCVDVRKPCYTLHPSQKAMNRITFGSDKGVSRTLTDWPFSFTSHQADRHGLGRPDKCRSGKGGTPGRRGDSDAGGEAVLLSSRDAILHSHLRDLHHHSHLKPSQQQQQQSSTSRPHPPPPAWAALSRLQGLYLSDLGLVDISDDLRHCACLRVLNVSGNQLQCLPCLPDSGSLTHLLAFENSIKQLPANARRSMRGLHVCLLNRNCLSTLCVEESEKDDVKYVVMFLFPLAQPSASD
jgi:hypothetical protein